MMKIKLMLSALLMLVVMGGANAQQDSISHWKVGGNGSFTFNQISLKNWAAGGKNSLSGTFLSKTTANYKSEKATWDNVLDLGYGMMKYDGEDYQKSEDKILLSSVYGYDAAKQKLFYSASFDFKSQFAKGYKYLGKDEREYVSKGFAPAYINLSLGMLYKPNDCFSFFLSPVTGHITVVSDTLLSKSYGLEQGDKVRMEYGASAKLNINKKNLVKNVDYFLRADFFSNLTDHPEHIDVDMETGFNLNVNDWLTAVLKFNILFDDDIKYKQTVELADGTKETRLRGARVQVKELFGFGLQFKWGK
ncbi:MAG: DUF3078 domain-containing protein [Bacteroidales bacterium]|nr:DUF3078 domain-containing protein [Bacteroidales bacterium]